MNLGAMMKQAQEMQAKLQEMQARLAQIELEGQAGGGMVSVLMTVKGEARKVRIDPQIVNIGDVAMLEDLVVAAINDSRSKAEQVVAKETEAMMGGLNLPPGFKLPI
ncbi:MAG: YbaB/EbfC family nucleoid-associated protein [Alphaproteobacteria bacterium]|nr:YbaB/EbfC family nucleoid-associated protein [Alphaproteobacteria bacterium]NDC56699.1 YbaB/EbfC family nucleoid-associated protein [Alphaproteobacteria bacterium]